MIQQWRGDEPQPMQRCEQYAMWPNDTIVWQPSNVYGVIGHQCLIGPFVTIQRGATVGDRCKIMDGAFICEGVVLEGENLIAAGVRFCNDTWPRATTPDGRPKQRGEWHCEGVFVGARSTIGANATILPGVHIGRGALIAAGSVVTENVPDREVWVGNPARRLRDIRENEE